MQQTSSLYRRLISDENHWFESTLVIGSGGDLITENGDKIIFGGWAIDVAGDSPGYGYNENQIMSIRTSTQVLNDGIAIGNCISQEIEVEMLKPSGELPRMSMITPYVRVAGEVEGNYTWEIVDGVLTFASYASITDSILTIAPTSGSSIIDGILYLPQDVTGTESEWLKQGEFFIDTKPCSHNDNGLEIMTIHGYDAMLKGNQYYTESKLSWPSRDILVLNEIAEMMGVEIDDRTRYLIGNLYPIEYPGGSYTLLETLGIIGSMYLGNWIITEQGKLRLISFADLPKETRYLTDSIGDILLFGVDRQESEVEVSGGAIASFDTDVYEMTELVADIDPQQDLHGYANPWPPGGGKNKLPYPYSDTTKIANGITYTDNGDGSITASGTATATAFFYIITGETPINLKAGTYTFTGTSGSVQFVYNDGANHYVAQGGTSATFESDTDIFLFLRVASGETVNVTVYPQIESGSTATAWTPYSNICPISGWTGLSGQRTGGNLLNKTGAVRGGFDASGNVLVNSGDSRCVTVFLEVKPNVTYYIDKTIPLTQGRAGFWYDANQTAISQISFNGAGVSSGAVTSPANAKYCRLGYLATNEDVCTMTVGSSALTPYEPYTGEAISVSFGQTVYGGSDEVVGGNGTSTMVSRILTGDENWIASSGYVNRFSVTLSDFSGASENYQHFLSNYLKASAWGTAKNTFAVRPNGGIFVMLDSNATQMTVEEFKSFLNTNPLQIVYELATPQTYQLTPQQVSTIAGHNNVFADTGNIESLKYLVPASQADRILV